MDLSEKQFLNADPSIVVRLFGKITSSRELQSKKAPLLNVVKPLGKDIDFRALHCSNELLPIDKKPLGK